MPQQHHRIFRLQVDYTLPEEEPVAAVQDRMSALIHNVLTKVMDELFSELGDTELYINIDQLELDVGNINIDELEKELPEKLEEQLRAQLPLLIKKNLPLSLSNLSTTKAKPILLEILIFYIRKGAYPWWMPSSVSRDITELFRDLLQSQRNYLQEALPDMMKTEWSRKRMVLEFENPDLEEVIELVEPAGGKTIIEYNNALEIQHERAPIIPMQQNDFRNLRWELILEYLHENRGTEFNQKSFLKQTLKSLALKFNLSFKELLFTLKEAVQKISVYYNQVNSLLKNIIELSGEIETENDSVQNLEHENLLRNFSEKERKIATAYLSILLEDKSYEELSIQDSSIWQKLIEKIWGTDQKMAISFIKKFIAKGKSHQHYVLQLPVYIKRSLLTDFYPDIAQELWTMRKALIKLLKTNQDKILRVPGIEKIIDRIYLQLLVAPLLRMNVRLLVERILSNITLKKQIDYYTFLISLFKAVQYSENRIHLSSGLELELKNIIGDFQNIHLRKTDQLKKEDWIFDAQKESITSYLSRLLTGIKNGSFRISNPAFFKSYPFWLAELLRRWNEDQQQLFFKILWSGSAAFARLWMVDMQSMLLFLYENQNIKKIPSSLRIQQIVWSVFFESGRMGPGRLHLVRESLSQLSVESLILESRFFEMFLQLSQSEKITLGLREVLPDLLKKAIQSKLFIPPSTKRTERIINIGEKENVLNVNLLSTYFEKEMLPGYMTLSGFRELIEKVQKEHVIAFRFFILKMIKSEFTRQRLVLFFSNEKNAELVDLIYPQAGSMALLFFTKYLKTQSNVDTLQWKRYWNIVWELVYDLHQNGFGFNNFIKQILNKIIIQFSIQPKVLIDALSAHREEGDTNMETLLHALLSREYYLYSFDTKQITAELKEPKILSDFSRLEISELATWVMQVLIKTKFKVEPSNVQNLLTFSRFIIKLPKKEKQIFWDSLNDQVTLQLFRRLLSDEEADRIVDLAVVLRQVEIENKKSQTRFFPFELSDLLLYAILNDRGSFSNQKTFIIKLLKDWARAHNLRYIDLLETLWPLIWKLSPVFKYHHTLNVFSDVLQEEISADRLEELYTSDKSDAKNVEKKNGEKDYKKLWDMDEKQIDFDDVWLIENAGLAILWPYLNTLFERLELMEESEFIDEKARQKAILVSQYLITGDKATAEEHLLIFNKVLCDFPIAAPITERLEVDESLEDLCDGLLQAVINHWSVLGDTSIDGFRTSFLIREGQLAQTQDFWQLDVKAKAYDVLLRQIPWGINPINLSWMDKNIKVNWQK